MNFNYKNLDRSSFTHWMFLNLLPSYVDNKEVWNELRKVTNNWENVIITIQINNVEVNADTFVDLVQRSLAGRSEVEAKKLISNALPDLDKLQEDINALNDGIRDKIHRWAVENNIDFDPYDD